MHPTDEPHNPPQGPTSVEELRTRLSRNTTMSRSNADTPIPQRPISTTRTIRGKFLRNRCIGSMRPFAYVTGGLDRGAFRYESGQAATEFVLVMIPMMVLLMLAIQYLLIWRANSYLEVAAYSAARKFAVHQDKALAKKVAMMYLDGIVSSDQVSLDFSSDHPGFAHPFTMVAKMQFPLLGVPLVQRLFTEHKKTVQKAGPYEVTAYDPPSAESLGLSRNQQVQIIDSKLIGYDHPQQYEWTGEVKEIVYKESGSYVLSTETNWHHFTHILSDTQPTLAQLGYRDYKEDKWYWFWHYQHVFQMASITKEKYGPAPRLEYEYTYNVLTITDHDQSDPSSITLESGAVMNAE
jgi:hypothetical protein